MENKPTISNVLLIYFLVFSFGLVSCGGPAKEAPDTSAEEIILDDLEVVEEVIVEEEKFKPEEIEVIEDRISQVEPESVGLLKGTDSPMYDPCTCDDNFIFNDVEICSNKHSEYNGNVLSIFNLKTKASFKIGTDYGCFFKGKFGNYIIVDSGTGNVRSLSIYDLSGKLKYETNYVNEMEINQDRLTYWIPVNRGLLRTLPECADSWEHGPDTLGIIDEYSLDLTTLMGGSTGRRDCQYME